MRWPGVGELQLREVHLADAEVGARVERAPVSDHPRAGEQPPASCSLSPDPARRQTSSATSCICLPVLRNPSALPRAPSGRRRAGRPSPAAPVAGPRRARRPSARRSGRRSAPRWSAPRDSGTAGEDGHPRGVGRRARPPGACRPPSRWDTSSTSRLGRGTPASHGASARRGEVVTARGLSVAQLRGRPEQHEPGRRPFCGGPAGRAWRSWATQHSPVRWTADTIRHSAAQPGPAHGQERDARAAVLPAAWTGPRDTPPRAPACDVGGRARTSPGGPHPRFVAASVVGTTARSTPPLLDAGPAAGRRTSPRHRCSHGP